MSDGGPQYPKYPGEGGVGREFESYPSGAESRGASSAPTPERPPSIVTAVRLMLAGAAISFVSIVVGLVTASKSDVAARLRDTTPDVTQSEIDAAFAVGLASAAIGGAIGVGLWLWMAWKNGQGRSWARVVATVLAGVNLLSVVVTIIVRATVDSGPMATETSPVGTALSVANLLIAAAILVLLWRKESSAYYDIVSRSKVI